MIDLCFDAAGVCYAYDLGVDNAYTINLATGNATLLGSLGYDANYGQGMSYDYESSTIYLSAFNNATVTGQLRTMNPGTGMTTLVTDWGFDQVAPFHCDTESPDCVPCVPAVDPPTNPNPPTGTTGVSAAGTTLSWTNGAGTTNVEVWFGPTGNVVQVYDGSAITSWPTGSLNYQTTYQWRIVCKNATCDKSGPTWNFTTENPPGIVFIEPFSNLNCWTWIGPLGQTNWLSSASANAGGTSPELECSWTPSYVGVNQYLSCVINSTGTSRSVT
jgi:hypothetical protein